ncbi:hypothetical protein QBZ16_000226 [Prototheca wickerhamii]|uniref:Uncharacterized protein n=1 Tax=Prototheca wickerhamii TaxID=3111 RepID=A0AAD9MMX6_PROWI|nr:hypothetical protein QBZ16_000226 [Prototheca wickerhamii]
MGHPQGDAQKYYTGRESRSLGPAGAASFLEKEAKVVGVASGLTNSLVCPTDFPDNDGNAYSAIASLARSWRNGMFKVFEGKRDAPPTSKYEPLRLPVPTLDIQNVLPTIYMPTGPARMTVSVRVSIRNLNPKIVTLNTTVLVFTSKNWSQPQTIKLATGPQKPALGKSSDFSLELLWEAVGSGGVAVNRTKRISGMLWNGARGSSSLNPLALRPSQLQHVDLAGLNTTFCWETPQDRALTAVFVDPNGSYNNLEAAVAALVGTRILRGNGAKTVSILARSDEAGDIVDKYLIFNPNVTSTVTS